MNAAENNPALGTLLSNILAHMSCVLDQNVCSWNELWNTDRAGAAEITLESRMLEGLFKYCDAQKLRNVNVGGFRMDVRNQAEMKIWKQYTEHLVVSRSAFYRIMFNETVHERNHPREAVLCCRCRSIPSRRTSTTDRPTGELAWRRSRRRSAGTSRCSRTRRICMTRASACETVFACLAHNDDGSTFADDFDVAGERARRSAGMDRRRRRARQRRRPGLDGSS